MALGHGLNISDVVNVTVTISPVATGFQNFGAICIAGPSDVVDTTERIRFYQGLDGIAQDFGTTAPEYLAAALFFSQSPQNSLVYIGRWAQTATKGTLNGGVLTPAQQVMANFTAVTAGGFFTYIDGVPYSITGLNFSTDLNLNAVALRIQSALVNAGATSTIVLWDAGLHRFRIKSGTLGVTSSVSYFAPATASGYINFAGNPSPNDTITIDGVIITFVAGSPSSFQVQIGGNLIATLTNLLTFLTTSSNSTLQLMTYSLGNAPATHLYVTAATAGVGGNSLTLAASAATPSGATLSGGSAVDISARTNTSSSTASVPVIGVAAETFAQCTAILDDVSQTWYGLTCAASTPPTDTDYLAAAMYIEGSPHLHYFGITIIDTSVLDPNNSADLGSQVQTAGLSKTLSQYSSSSPYAVASMMARMATVDFTANNTTITAKFKKEPGVAGEILSESQAQTLKNKNINVFVDYAGFNAPPNIIAIVQEGVMANGFFFDERVGIDWLKNTIQVNCFNELYTSPTKVPQTDAGTHRLVNRVNEAGEAGRNNGLIAPGRWNGDTIGQLANGDYLSIGYYTFAPPVATQAQADREARKSVPIQMAVKFAGAIHFANVAVTVNR